MIPVEKNKADAVKNFIGSVKEASASIEVNDKIVNFVSNSFNKMKKGNYIQSYSLTLVKI